MSANTTSLACDLRFPGRARCRDERSARYLDAQAMIARALGSPLIADILDAAQRQLDRAPCTAALLAGWPGDLAADAMAMRLNGALHALARRGSPPALKALYAGLHRDFDGAIGEALAAGDLFVAEWMREPTQTNEVGRAAAILAALMVARADFGLPFELLELGSSCGLNLNLAHYAYDLGGIGTGRDDAAVRIAPDWAGPPPPVGPVDIVRARGVDLHPLDPADARTRERLLSFIWADQPARATRLEQALAVARGHPPQVDRADALPWLRQRLAEPQPDGQCRALVHSMLLQYLEAGDRQAVADEIARAGARATAARPLIRIGFEWNVQRTEVQLLLTTWPGGHTRQLASCHPYGDWVNWRTEAGKPT